MKPKNIKAAQELVKRYNTITLEEIETTNPETLTGFGSPLTCTLCVAVTVNNEVQCSDCIYGGHFCMHNENSITYFVIANARNPKELLKAYRARAEHIQNILDEIQTRD